MTRDSFDETTSTDDAGIPRRSAVQGMAGALAALGIAGAATAAAQNGPSAQHRPARRVRGAIKRVVERHSADVSIPANTLDPPVELTVACNPAAGTETVYALSGGYTLGNAALSVAEIGRNGAAGWRITVRNTDLAAHNASVSVICAYVTK